MRVRMDLCAWKVILNDFCRIYSGSACCLRTRVASLTRTEMQKPSEQPRPRDALSLHFTRWVRLVHRARDGNDRNWRLSHAVHGTGPSHLPPTLESFMVPT